MKLFLLEFDRTARQLVGDVAEFPLEQQSVANATRLEMQRRVRREHLDHDVVLLQAESSDVLRETHGSFFLTPQQLVERLEATG